MSRGVQPGFNKSCAVFTPEGRLLQVEYAIKAIDMTNITSVAVLGADCAVVATQKVRAHDKFIVEETKSQMYLINDYVGCCMTGLVGDSRSLVMSARYASIAFYKWTKYHMPADCVLNHVSDVVQVHTQNGEARPLACTMILVSFIEECGPSILKLDPDGHYCGYLACAAGTKRLAVEAYLDHYYKRNMSQPWVIGFAVRALMHSVWPETLEPETIQIGIIGKKNHLFTELDPEDVEYYVWNNTEVPPY